jgi:phosphatidylinositol dimannoside acyltransferase
MAAMRPAKNAAKDLGRLFFWYPFRWLVLAMPPQAIPLAGALMGRLDLLLSGRGRTTRMSRNIATALNLDESAARRVLLANLANHAMNMLEFLRYPRMDAARCARAVDWEGREHLDAALAQGRGVVLCTAHFGAKQLLQVALGHAGYAVNQINYHLPESNLSWAQARVSQRWRRRIEESIPCRFISAGAFMRDAFRCLRRNELLIVAADGAGIRELMDDSFQPRRFLGRAMRFPTNYVSLAARTGAALLPVFAVRDGRRHRLVFHPPLAAEGEQAVRDYVALLENHVRRRPDLWEFWEEFQEGELLVNEGVENA